MAEPQQITARIRDQSTVPATIPAQAGGTVRAKRKFAVTTPTLAPRVPRERSATGAAPEERDSYAVTAFADITDRSLHATAARFTMGLSPAALAYAYLDWITHLAFSPGKRLQLVDKAIRKATRFTNYACQCALKADKKSFPTCIEPLPQDRRFVGAEWQKWPYNFIYQAFLLNQQWWHNATTGIRGVTKTHENMVQFLSRQILDMFSPSNFLPTSSHFSH